MMLSVWLTLGAALAQEPSLEEPDDAIGSEEGVVVVEDRVHLRPGVAFGGGLGAQRIELRLGNDSGNTSGVTLGLVSTVRSGPPRFVVDRFPEDGALKILVGPYWNVPASGPIFASVGLNADLLAPVRAAVQTRHVVARGLLFPVAMGVSLWMHSELKLTGGVRLGDAVSLEVGLWPRTMVVLFPRDAVYQLGWGGVLQPGAALAAHF